MKRESYSRPGDPRLNSVVRLVRDPLSLSEQDIVILGSPDDLGVRLNGGRPGASQGPGAIRKHLYKMTPPLDGEWSSISLVDGGDTEVSTEIRQTHAHARERARAFSAKSDVILLGGGHDFAAPHFIGFVDGMRERGGEIPQAGLVNIDPHLDVREFENDRPHSGTPFREILDSKSLLGQNLIQFGFRRNRNAKQHLQYCLTRGVACFPFEDMRKKQIPGLFSRILGTLAQRTSTIAITIDMDSCKDAEGTSAAPVVGFSTEELCEIGELAGRHPKVNYFEIAEVAPPLDFSDRSARIAAEIIYAYLWGRSNRASAKASRKRPVHRSSRRRRR